jgi:hypothetical protein
MQIVININDHEYEEIKEDAEVYKNKGMVVPYLYKVIESGIPLPEGCDIQCIIPKRVDVQKWIYTKCPNPNCNYELSTHHGDGYYSIEHKPDFCPNCGQALLWESEE